MLALGFLLFATVLLTVAVFVGFYLYMNTDLSSGASVGITALPAVVIWVVALVVGSLVPISRLNRARCAVLQEQIGATHAWSLTESASIDDLITKVSLDGVPSSARFHKMLLAVDSESFSFWLVQKRQLRRVLRLPTSTLADAYAQPDPGSGTPLGMKVCLTVRTPDGSAINVQFNPAPTTMHLLTEPETTAATLQTYARRSRASGTT